MFSNLPPVFVHRILISSLRDQELTIIWSCVLGCFLRRFSGFSLLLKNFISRYWKYQPKAFVHSLIKCLISSDALIFYSMVLKVLNCEENLHIKVFSPRNWYPTEKQASCRKDVLYRQTFQAYTVQIWEHRQAQPYKCVACNLLPGRTLKVQFGFHD
jgi:hypothetical protein